MVVEDCIDSWLLTCLVSTCLSQLHPPHVYEGCPEERSINLVYHLQWLFLCCVGNMAYLSHNAALRASAFLFHPGNCARNLGVFHASWLWHQKGGFIVFSVFVPSVFKKKLKAWPHQIGCGKSNNYDLIALWVMSPSRMCRNTVTLNTLYKGFSLGYLVFSFCSTYTLLAGA